MFLNKNFLYLLYKTFNTILVRMYRKNLYGDIVFSKSSIKSGNSARILFDFSHATTHLGDRLFFAPLIFELIHKGLHIYISKDDTITHQLFKDLNNSLHLYKYDNNLPMDLVVVPSPSLTALSYKHDKNKLLICEFSSIQKQNIIAELNMAFSNITGLCLKCSPKKYISKKNSSFRSSKNDQYYIFSNYIDSGWFRKFFVRGMALEEKAIKLRADGYKIAHVGTHKDAKNDNQNYDFIDLDLRGELTITELINFINSRDVVGAVTYDNFIMHLIGIFDKKAYVLFRGRFIKKNVDMHYKFINEVFFDDNNKIHYLK